MINEELISDVVNRLVTNFKPNKIILFGSQAKGNADPYSDYDILVICPISNKRRSLMLEMDIALEGLGIARDIVILTPEEFEMDRNIPGTIARPAYLEGKVLYDIAQ